MFKNILKLFNSKKKDIFYEVEYNEINHLNVEFKTIDDFVMQKILINVSNLQVLNNIEDKSNELLLSEAINIMI